MDPLLLLGLESSPKKTVAAVVAIWGPFPFFPCGSANGVSARRWIRRRRTARPTLTGWPFSAFGFGGGVSFGGGSASSRRRGQGVSFGGGALPA